MANKRTALSLLIIVILLTSRVTPDGLAATKTGTATQKGPMHSRIAESGEIDSAPRSYYLGFTPFPHDISEQAVDYVYNRIKTCADIIAHHFDGGVPWPEALAGEPYHQNVQNDWQNRKNRTPPDHKRYLALTPINLQRNDLARYWGEEESMALPPPWDGYGFDHPDVQTAFFNHVVRAVEFFDPHYLTIGVEVNELLTNSPDAWPAYLTLHRNVYTALKQVYPDLCIMVSFFGPALLDGYRPEDDHEAQMAAFPEVMAYSDLFGISLYSYLSKYLCDPTPPAMFEDLFSLSEKRIAITETGYPAQFYSFFEGAVVLTGTPQKQRDFMAALLAEADAREFAFVINFVLRDYDALWEKISLPDTNGVWRDTGLWDENGQPRPALDPWFAALARNPISVKVPHDTAVWSKWVQLPDPIFTGQYLCASDPVIIKEGTLYRMLYTGLNVWSDRTIICEAISHDGFQWTNVPTGNPLLEGVVLAGETGDWDENMETNYTLFHDNEYLMYYMGYADEGQPPYPGAEPYKGIPGYLGLARSVDGVHFERHGDPVMYPTPEGCDEDAIVSPVVIPLEQGFFMLYAGHRYSLTVEPSGVFLCGAVSLDGEYWIKLEEPIMGPSDKHEWFSWGPAEPDLILGPDHHWYLFFTGFQEEGDLESHVIGIARAPSLLGPWTLNPEPILTPQHGTFCDGGVLAPHVMIEGNRVRMWHLGVGPDHDYYFTGYAESTWPLFKENVVPVPVKQD